MISAVISGGIYWLPPGDQQLWGLLRGRTEPAARAVPPHQLGSKRAAPAQGMAENQLPEDRRGFGHCLLAGHLEGPGTRGTRSSYELVPGPSGQTPGEA